MAWVQVQCPTCDAALQAWVEEGTTTVQCSAPAPRRCTMIFDVYVPAGMLPQRQAPPSRRKLHAAVLRGPQAYNAFMKTEIPKVKQALPAGLSRRERQHAAFQGAAANWHCASANPKNGAAGSGGAAAAAAANDVGGGVLHDERGAVCGDADALAAVDMLTRAADLIGLDGACGAGESDDEAFESADEGAEADAVAAAAGPGGAAAEDLSGLVVCNYPGCTDAGWAGLSNCPDCKCTFTHHHCCAIRHGQQRGRHTCYNCWFSEQEADGPHVGVRAGTRRADPKGTPNKGEGRKSRRQR